MDFRENLAPNSKRVWSYTIDNLVVSGLFIAIFYEQIVSLQSAMDMSIFIKSHIVVLLALELIYQTLFIYKSGKTLGKYILKIKTVDQDNGNLLTFDKALIRAFVRLISENFFYLGFLPAFFTDKRQTLHDIAAKDIVINE